MRTSNKILLGTFFAILIIITGIHAALYAKFRNNDFITMTSLHRERYDRYDIKDVRTVSLSGLQYVTIVRGDTARLEIEKNNGGRVHYQFLDGVLTIKGDTTIMRNGTVPDRIKASQNVILYLPGLQDIKSDFCELVIRGNRDKSNSDSLALALHESELHLGGWSRNWEDYDSLAINFNRINITNSVKSTIDVTDNIKIKEISLSLESSEFEDGKMSCDSLTIKADNSSSVKLSGENIAKTKFVLKP